MGFIFRYKPSISNVHFLYVTKVKKENEDEDLLLADSSASTQKLYYKCLHCNEKFRSIAEIKIHDQVQHPVLGKRRPKPMNLDKDIMSEDSSDTEDTDPSLDEESDEEDEFEIALNDSNATDIEDLKKIFKKQLASTKDTKNSDYSCLICNNDRKMNQQQLFRHYRKHERLIINLSAEPETKPNEESPDVKLEDLSCQYYCHTCKNDLKMTKSELLEHYEEMHETKIVNKKEFFRRARSKRPRSPRPEVFRCEICSKEFSERLLHDKHIQEHEDQYSCDECNSGFKRLIEYTFHMQRHNEDKLYKCALCEFETDKGYLVKSHLYSVHEQFKKYKCDICNKGFAIFTHFQEHKYFHTGEKPFQCNICGQKFMYTRYLNSHIVQMHKAQKKGLECKICKKVYSHRNSLNTHMKSHTGSVSVCDVCGKTLCSNEKLRLHYRIHTGEKPYKCDYCEKSFKTSSYRAEHERVHTGEKPYSCPYCERGFSQRTSMVIHSRGHTGEKPYLCHLCNKSFAAKSMVTIHLKSCKGIRQDDME